MCFGNDRLDMEQPVGIWPFLFFSIFSVACSWRSGVGRSCQLWEDPGGCGASSLPWAGAHEVGNECVRSKE